MKTVIEMCSLAGFFEKLKKNEGFFQKCIVYYIQNATFAGTNTFCYL